MKYNERTVNKADLVFNEEVSVVDYTWPLPVLISDENKVYAGNSLRKNLPDKVLCAVIPRDDYLEDCMVEIEKFMAEENNIDRYKRAQEEIKEYLKRMNPDVQTFSLFEDADTIDRATLITQENYIEPSVKFDWEQYLKGRGG